MTKAHLHTHTEGPTGTWELGDPNTPVRDTSPCPNTCQGCPRGVLAPWAGGGTHAMGATRAALWGSSLTEEGLCLGYGTLRDAGKEHLCIAQGLLRDG